MIKIKNQKGQSLLEMLIALSILIVALTATLVLIVTSINAARESKYKLIATSLAREGIEVVRNIRDSNWVDPASPSPAWDDGLFPSSGDDTTAIPVIPVFNGSNSTNLDFTVNSLSDINARIKQDSNNNYLQGNGVVGNNTIFYRVLTLIPICRKTSDGSESFAASNTSVNDCGSDEEVGLKIISEVRWPSSSSSRKVIIEDRLYDWQQL